MQSRVVYQVVIKFKFALNMKDCTAKLTARHNPAFENLV